MPPRQSHSTAEDDAAREDAELTRRADEAAGEPEDGPSVIDGPFGTTLDSTDQRLGTLRVEVKSNVTLGNELYRVGQKVRVVDDAETRGAIAVGHARLLDDDEALDSE